MTTRTKTTPRARARSVPARARERAQVAHLREAVPQANNRPVRNPNGGLSGDVLCLRWWTRKKKRAKRRASVPRFRLLARRKKTTAKIRRKAASPRKNRFRLPVAPAVAHSLRLPTLAVRFRQGVNLRPPHAPRTGALARPLRRAPPARQARDAAALPAALGLGRGPARLRPGDRHALLLESCRAKKAR